MGAKDPSRTSIRVANSLEQVGNLELLQAPGLPFTLPRQYVDRPLLTGAGSVAAVHGLAWGRLSWPARCALVHQATQRLDWSSEARCARRRSPTPLSLSPATGRAVVELTVEKADGGAAFVDPDSDGGPQRQARVQLVLDGYSAPVTAGNFLANVVLAGRLTAAPLSVSPVSVLGGSEADGAAAPLPLEMLPAGDFEPLYRTRLDVRSGELPVLPLSIYGAVAMAHLPGDDAGGGLVSSQRWFIYKFDRSQAGLSGLSFDEGEFGVLGYVTKVKGNRGCGLGCAWAIVWTVNCAARAAKGLSEARDNALPSGGVSISRVPVSLLSDWGCSCFATWRRAWER